MSDIKLYNYFRSSTSYRVRIALELKKLNYDYKPIHLLQNGGEQNQPAYRKLNPIGGVPTLEHKGRYISQSMAIIQYLDEVFTTDTQLFPSDPFLKAKILQVCETINADIHPLQNLKVTQHLDKNLNITPEQKQNWLNKWISEGLGAVEKTIEPYLKKYSFGDGVTAADLFIVPQIFSAQRFGVDITPYPNLNHVNRNCLELEAFKRAHPLNQPDTPDDLKKT